MSFSYKRWVGVGILFLILVLIGTTQSSAQTSTAASTFCPSGPQIQGWAWSSNIGWISFSSENASGGGGPHCVALDSTNKLVGWAWSSNIGWIKFGNLTSFPVAATFPGNAQIVGGEIVGWARACAGTISGDCQDEAPRLDGWDGFIELSGPNHSLAYNGSSITGYAWGSSVVGWIQSVDLHTSGTPTTCSGSACNATCSLTSSESNGTYKLNWTSVNASSCAPDGSNPNNFTVNSVAGSATVYPAAGQSTLYGMTCAPKLAGGGSAFCSATITIPGGPPGGGTNPTCPDGSPTCLPTNAPAIQMWLNNDPNQSLGAMTIRLGQNAKMNWKKTVDTDYERCDAAVDQQVVAGFSTSEALNGSPFSIPSSLLTPGEHKFTMKCTPEVGADVSGRTLGQLDFLNIRVIDPTLEEI